MRIFVLLAAVLLSTVAAPTDGDNDSTELQAPLVSTNPVHYRTETLEEISRKTTADNVQSQTKSKEKIKIKHLKNGGTKEIIVDSSRTKTKKNSVSDEYSQTKHTLTEDGLEDSTILTKDHLHKIREVDVVKKKDREVIIRDKYGNIISDKKKSKSKEKKKKKEKDRKKSVYLHTVKRVDPPADLVLASTDYVTTTSPPAC